jgi:surface polysaccharide O-acyltransferase-like enzyme
LILPPATNQESGLGTTFEEGIIGSPALESASGTKARRVAYTDALRVAGAVAVIFIHVTGDGSSAVGTLSFNSWLFCATLETLARFAVPIFVMVSGCLLLSPDKSEQPGEFYTKRLRRIAIPTIGWSVFYLAWRWFYEGERFHVTTALFDLISGGAYYHLWFMSMLIGLYIATPALRVVVRGFSMRQLWWTTGTLLVLGMGDAIARANEGSDFTFLFKFCPFIGLFLLGYCLRDVRWPKRTVWLGFIGWIVGAVVSLIGTYILVFHCATSGWDIDDRLFLMCDEFSPGSLIMCVSVFAMFAAWNGTRRISRPSGIVQTLSAASLGIYLSHPLFLSILNAQGIDYEWHGVLIGVPVSIIVAALGATALTLLLSKIPALKLLV